MKAFNRIFSVVAVAVRKRTGNGHSKSTSTIPMSELWTSQRTRKCGKWNGNICSVPHVKPPKYRRGRRKSMLLPIHIYFYPYLV